MSTRYADKSNGRSNSNAVNGNAVNGNAVNGNAVIDHAAFETVLTLHAVSATSSEAVAATQGDAFAELDAHADQVRERVMRAMRDVDEMHPERLREANGQLVREALRAVQLAKLAVHEFGVLAHTSRHDALTGTPDRIVMHDRMEQATALARRRGSRIAVFFLDLDDFKQINDTLGHAAGDEALRLVARRLESVVRDSDTVSRHGGDEFLVLLADVAQASDVIAVAASMLSVLAEPAQVGGHAVTLSGSLGVALFPEDGEDPDSLIARADAAMYRAKRAGGGAFRCCSDALTPLPTPARDGGAGGTRMREASPAADRVAGWGDLVDILGRAVARSRSTLAARHQVLTWQLAPGALAVNGDAVRLAQAFSRLLDNASTHTPSGGAITLATRELSGAVTVTVSDNGFGIVPEALPGIFEERLHDTFAKTRGNCEPGVERAGVRDLVEAYGGSVVVTSAGKNLGSSFAVTLPKA